MSDLKRALLEGTRYLEAVRLKKPNGEALEVQVRPLSSREAAEVEALSKQGKMQVNVDVGRFQNQQWKADVRAVAYGLSHGEEKWSDDEVAGLLPTWVNQLASVVRRISGVERPSVASFRVVGDGAAEAGGGGGDGDAGAEPGGGAPGPDAE
jgi:hypothetical protein